MYNFTSDSSLNLTSFVSKKSSPTSTVGGSPAGANYEFFPEISVVGLDGCTESLIMSPLKAGMKFVDGVPKTPVEIPRHVKKCKPPEPALEASTELKPDANFVEWQAYVEHKSARSTLRPARYSKTYSRQLLHNLTQGAIVPPPTYPDTMESPSLMHPQRGGQPISISCENDRLWTPHENTFINANAAARAICSLSIENEYTKKCTVGPNCPVCAKTTYRGGRNGKRKAVLTQKRKDHIFLMTGAM